jgi:hypothetical protein
MLEAVRGVRARRYYQRQSLWELGPTAEAWLTELVHRRSTQWRPAVEQCFGLLQQHGPGPLRAAFAWGLGQSAIGAEYVAAHLRGEIRDDGAPREPLRGARSHDRQGGRYVDIPLRAAP